MKTNHEQLDKHLNKPYTLFLVAGDEPLLINETLDILRKNLKEKSFTERENIQVNTQFNWSTLSLKTQNYSLFSDKQLIELQFTNKPNAAHAAALKTYLQNTNESQAVIIIAPKLDAGAQKQAWYRLIEASGLCIHAWPPQPYQLPQWIQQRFQAAGLQAEPSVIQLLAMQTEGNLLATAQSIEKLKLAHNNEKITLEHLREQGHNQSQYDVFSFIDNCLARQSNKIGKVLSQLKTSGVEPTIILWGLTRELRVLINITEMLQNTSLPAALQQSGVWEKRKPLYINYFKNTVQLNYLYRLLQFAAKIDRLIKGIDTDGDTWEALLELSLRVGK